MPRDGSSTFRLRSRYCLVTWSRADNFGTTADDINQHLRVFEHKGRGLEYILYREDHSDEGHHFHAFIDFGQSPDIRTHDIFDVAFHHPNITASRGNPAQGWDYVSKEGNCVGGSLARPEPECTRNSQSLSQTNATGKQHARWTEIISSVTRDEFFERIARLDPKVLCTSFNNLQLYADWKYRPEFTDYEGYALNTFDTTLVPGWDDWLLTDVNGEWDGLRR